MGSFFRDHTIGTLLSISFFIAFLALIFVINLMQNRRLRAYQGDEHAALHLILPCYKPYLRVVAFFFLLFSIGLILASFVDGTIPFVTKYKILQLFLSFNMTLLVFILFTFLQPAISIKTYYISSLFVLPWTLCWFIAWMLYVLLPTSSNSFSEYLFAIVYFLPPFLTCLLVYLGIRKGRIQLKSHSNRSIVDFIAFLSVLDFVFFLVIGSILHGTNDNHELKSPSPTSTFVSLTIALVIIHCLANFLFPLMLYRTLLADTKYWRGLGKHNKGGFTSSLHATNDIDEEEGGGMGGGGGGFGPDTRRKHTTSVSLDVASSDFQTMLNDYREVALDFAYLEVGELIGKGSTSEVFRGKFKGQDVAVKLFLPPELTAEEVQTIATEAALTSSLSHPNIVRLYGICVRPPQIAMVLELCKTNLKDSLVEDAAYWTPIMKFKAARDACRAVAFIHACGMIHRDLKAENFFIDEEGVVKLGDFGESTIKRDTTGVGSEQEEIERKMTIVGTVAHMAPEMIDGVRKYTEAVDVYSLGITLWEIWTGGQDPFAELNTFQVYKSVLEEQQRPPVPEDCPSSYADIMTRAWAHEADNRPTAERLAMFLERATKELEMDENEDEEKSEVEEGKLADNRKSRHSSVIEKVKNRLSRVSQSLSSAEVSNPLHRDVAMAMAMNSDEEEEEEGGGMEMTGRSIYGRRKKKDKKKKDKKKKKKKRRGRSKETEEEEEDEEEEDEGEDDGLSLNHQVDGQEEEEDEETPSPSSAHKKNTASMDLLNFDYNAESDEEV